MRRHLLRFAVAALFASAAGTPGRAADYDLARTLSHDADYSGGVPCDFTNWAPTIALPPRTVWLGHFSGGRFTRTAYGNELDWKNEKICFPSRASCGHWIAANRRAYHHPEGYWTCLPIR